MSLPQPPSESSNNSVEDDNGACNRKNQRSRSLVKLRKLPPVPIRRSHTIAEIGDNNGDDDDSQKEQAVTLDASSLGLNHIRSHSCSDSTATKLEPQQPAKADPGKKVSWGQSRSLKVELRSAARMERTNPTFTKEMQSPSGRKKKIPDIKGFSHELNSKGVRPLPIWKPHAHGHVEEIMVMLKGKFEKLKEEVNSDLGIFAGDLVGILEESSQEWKEMLEDLLIMARKCAKMTPNEFWSKCESIVQTLDGRRQDSPVGIPKQVHTRLLFILTRCTRLVQFHNECGREDSQHILGLHQLINYT